MQARADSARLHPARRSGAVPRAAGPGGRAFVGAGAASSGGEACRDAEPARVLLWFWGSPGAGTKFTAELAAEMRLINGLDLSVSSVRGSELHARSTALGLPTYDVPTFSGDKAAWSGRLAAGLAVTRLPLLARGFRRMLAESRADVALCAFPSIWDAATLPALSGGSARFVLVLHDAFFHPGDEYPLRHWVLRRQIGAADALIVLSDHVRKQAIAAFGYPADRIWVMPHGAFEFGTEEVRPAVHPRGARPLRLLFFGRIVAYKGLGHLLRALRMLRERGMPVELTIAGSGSLEPYADLLEGLSGVRIHNRWLAEEEIARFMTAADVAMLPYVEASQSGVAATAYAAGRPVVATPIGGLPEQVSHGTTGLLARDMSVEALADAIAAFANDPDLLDSCASGALGHARTALSWRKSAETVAEAVDAVRAAPRRGAGVRLR